MFGESTTQTANKEENWDSNLCRMIPQYLFTLFVSCTQSGWAQRLVEFKDLLSPSIDTVQKKIIHSSYMSSDFFFFFRTSLRSSVPGKVHNTSTHTSAIAPGLQLHF